MIVADDMTTWRILIVDDEPDNLNVASDFFEFSGATVFRAQNGPRALELFTSAKPNLALLDLAMPDMDGWEVYRRLRDLPGGKEIPIVALTALAMSTDVQRANLEGFDGYITKPFRITKLLETLQACVRTVLARQAVDEWVDAVNGTPPPSPPPPAQPPAPTGVAGDD